MTLEEYKSALEDSRTEATKLREENNRFRLMLLTEALEPDQIYLAQKKNQWALEPVEKLMMFMELFEAHAKIHAELVHLKMSKDDIKAHLNKRTGSKEKAAREFRVKTGTGLTEDEKIESRLVSKEDAAKQKAVKSLAKSLKITYAAAEKMLAGMSLAPAVLTYNKK